MSTTQSTLAQLLYKTPPEINFVQVVGELEAILGRYPATHRALTWDRKDIAVFDIDGSRIVLGWQGALTGIHGACLTVSVGHGPKASDTALLAERRASLCRLICDRLAARQPHDGVIWHDIDAPVTPDLIEALLERLPRRGKPRPVGEPAGEVDRLLARMSVELQTRVSQPVPNFEPPERTGFLPAALRPPEDWMLKVPEPRSEPAAPVALAVANDVPAVPRLHDEEAAVIRAALYPPEPEKQRAQTRPSTQMRLAVHAMNSTLILVYLPVGAAMLTYSLLRGENMRASTQAMVLTGLMMLASQTPLGQQVVPYI